MDLQKQERRPFQTRRSMSWVGLLMILGLMGVGGVGCFGFLWPSPNPNNPNNSNPPNSTTEPINPSNPTNPTNPTNPNNPTDPTTGEVVQWRKLAKWRGEDWKTREQGPGTPLVCRISQEKQSVWCFDRYAQAFVELFAVEGQKILALQHSPSGRRMAVLLENSEGSRELRVATSPFVQFQTVRTFHANGTEHPMVSNIAFVQEDIFAYGKGVMLSEKSEFLTPLPGSQELPALGDLHFVNAGYYLSINQETGALLRNAPESMATWREVPPPQSGSQARALQVAVAGDVLATLYHDGSLYWRCSESSGMLLTRLTRKVDRVFWFQGQDGYALLTQSANDVRYVSLGGTHLLQLPKDQTNFWDGGSLGVMRFFLESRDNAFEGTWKPPIAGVLCN